MSGQAFASDVNLLFEETFLIILFGFLQLGQIVILYSSPSFTIKSPIAP